MAVRDKLHSIAEFEQMLSLPENSSRLLELFQGEITEKMPAPDHAAVAARMTTLLDSYVIANGDLSLVLVEGRHQIGDGNSVLPDVAYFRDMDTSPGGKRFSVMPDLAIEIKSPDDSESKLREKADYYLANGSQAVWLVLPETRQIEVHKPNNEVQTLGVDDTLDGGEVLPGFAVPVSRIFAKIAR